MTLFTATRGVAALVATAAFLAPAVALANPRPLPFTYTYPTVPKGDYEVEQYVDFEPVKALASSGEKTFYGATQLQTEFEIGLTDRLELGLYATFVPRPGDGFQQTPVLPEGNGAKERLRLRLAEEGQWPIDVGFYFEVVENEREIELELKAILARRIGDFHINANLSAEFEAYYNGDKEIVLNPSAGITWQVTPGFHPGWEWWMHSEHPIDPAPGQSGGFNRKAMQYVGPAMMFNFGKIWWSSGAYFRLNDVSYAIQPGDAFGPVWLRTVVGFGF